ncbi:hypothetical protein TH53_05090 [Pedobacter lusitanus]|uniref:Contig19, whole genome shotgun sequence n=1 Tax=Pedobacter lusitanus TaxID=1503925 RepID=A0A0D0GUX3_9SPHI|nr:alpha/beta hydrolase [Pedobacter lusitanus]KIO78221.1 hypothetical protein TH53_05090 [Pedobacter lusitanus]
MNSNSVISRNNVNIIGNGSKVILFAHGFGCAQNSWQYIVNSFTDEYKVVLFDYVGSGQSDLTHYRSDKYSKLNGYAQDIIDICEELKISDAIFIAHSVSCMIGLLAAIEKPHFFEQLILLGPSPKYINTEDYIGGFEQADLEELFKFMDSNYLGWSSALAPAIMGNPDRPELGQFLTNSFCSTDPDIAREFARATFFSDNRDDLQKLNIKSLTLQCSDDIIAPASVGNFVNKHLRNNTLVMMEATGHCPHISEPVETVRLIKEFIA